MSVRGRVVEKVPGQCRPAEGGVGSSPSIAGVPGPSSTARPRLPLVTDEPAVLTWMIALAPQRRAEPVGRHWWRELVTEAWSSAMHAWWLQREAAAIGYKTEEREFEAQHPRPRLRDFMEHLSSGRLAPESIR